jgi:hypothetical protein
MLLSVYIVLGVLYGKALVCRLIENGCGVIYGVRRDATTE